MCAGCSGNKRAATVAAGTPEPATLATLAGEDTTEFTVAYFNGTTENVVGLEAVRQRVINPASRAAGTDENGLQGATYAPRR